jgi:hypothetical protein
MASTIPNAQNGKKKGSVGKFKSMRQQIVERKLSLVAEAVDLMRKTRDEQLKFEIIKFLAQYSQAIPTSNPEEEGASVSDISERQLLAIAQGNTACATEPDADTTGSDSDVVCEGESDAADALDAETNDGSLE